MNHTFLAVVLTSFMGTVAANYNSNHIIVNVDPCCTTPYYGDPYYFNNNCSGYEYHSYEQYLPSEKNLRRKLYWLYNYNPRALEIKGFPLDYFINILTDHIQALEYKILQKRTGLRSGAMLRGTMISAFSALWGYLAHDAYTKNLKAGSRDSVEVVILGTVSAILAVCAGTQFDKVYRYTERLFERLERDKQIRAVLERIKFSQL
jgi:hypothetical protein